MSLDKIGPYFDELDHKILQAKRILTIGIGAVHTALAARRIRDFADDYRAKGRIGDLLALGDDLGAITAPSGYLFAHEVIPHSRISERHSEDAWRRAEPTERSGIVLGRVILLMDTPTTGLSNRKEFDRWFFATAAMHVRRVNPAPGEPIHEPTDFRVHLGRSGLDALHVVALHELDDIHSDLNPMSRPSK